MKYNDYTSVCNECRAKGWFEKPTKCTRERTEPCKCCSSLEYGKLKQCKGMNVLMDYSGIAKHFAHYHETQQRIEVEFSHGEIKRGTVGITTGWKPVFILMARSNSIGSSDVLNDDDKIVKVI